MYHCGSKFSSKEAAVQSMGGALYWMVGIAVVVILVLAAAGAF
jgi:hypothetical protein